MKCLICKNEMNSISRNVNIYFCGFGSCERFGLLTVAGSMDYEPKIVVPKTKEIELLDNPST